MAITKDDKKAIISKFAKSKSDTWSAEVQVAILTARIKNLQEHMETHKSDNHSRRWIILMVAKRRRMLNYLKKKDPQRYDEVMNELKIRKS